MRIPWFLKLILAVLICESAGGLGAIVTVPAVATWYAALKKPFFNPPDWVFAPVWNILFLMMGISLFLVWQKGFEQEKSRRAVLLFFVQLLLNVIWSFLFFGLRSPLLAFFEIVILWFAILQTVRSFWEISRWAGALNIPYLVWVGFATVLNYQIWVLNR